MTMEEEGCCRSGHRGVRIARGKRRGGQVKCNGKRRSSQKPLEVHPPHPVQLTARQKEKKSIIPRKRTRREKGARPVGGERKKLAPSHSAGQGKS